MAKATSSKLSRVIVSAVLDELRLFSERVQNLDMRERKTGVQVQAQVVAKSTVGMGLVLNAEGQQRLLINHRYRVDLVALPGGEPLCEYESEFRALFAIAELVGVDLEKSLPISAVDTYIQQVAWIARSRAQGTLGQLGLGGVMLPKQTSYEPDGEQTTEAPKASRKTRVGSPKDLKPLQRPRP